MFKKIGIIGLGLIGGSFLKAIRAKLGESAYLIGIDKVNIESDLLDAFSDDIKDAFSCDLLILATPPLITMKILDLMPQDKVIFDVMSVKACLEPLSLKLSNFVPNHPIAGKETGGFENSRAELLYDAKSIITPNKNTNPMASKQVWDFLEVLGMKVEVLSANKHDEIYAAVSHLPQLIAFWYRSLLNDDILLNLRSTNRQVKEFSRLCFSNYNLWREIFCLNRSKIEEALEQLTISQSEAELDTVSQLPIAISNSLIKTNKFTDYTGTGFASMTVFKDSVDGDDMLLNRKHICLLKDFFKLIIQTI